MRACRPSPLLRLRDRDDADSLVPPAAVLLTSSTRTVSSESNSSPASISSRTPSSCTASTRTSVRPIPSRPSSSLLTSPFPADYRKRPRELSKVYFSPITPSTRSEISKLFTASCSSLTPGEEIIANRTLHVWGRPVSVPMSTSKVAQFEFSELCGQPHSAADYLEITKTFGTIFLTDVPQLGLETKDQARRFILFVDSAYEARVRFLSFPFFLLLPPPLTPSLCARRPNSSSSPTPQSTPSSPTRNPKRREKSPLTCAR